MSVSINEVAHRACVSRGTVSKVLNGSRERIGLATQERVRRAAQELGYRPNAIARSLRRRCTDTLGFYSGHGCPWWLTEDLQRACERHSKDLLIHGAFRNASVDALVAELASGRIDGLLLVPILHDPLAERLAALSARGEGIEAVRPRALPAVAIADAVPGLPSVVVDDVAAGRLMAEHLAERGHRHVLYRDAYLPRTSTVRRLKAFQASAHDLGLTVQNPTPAVWPGGELTDEEVRLLTTTRADRPTAVACFSEDVAAPVLHAAPRLGLSVPNDLALVTTGGGFVDGATRLRPTFVRTPWADVAHRAVDVLVDIIAGKEAEPETVLSVELVIGDTS